MTEPQIRFDDGAAYERIMGIWSQLAGEQFLDWLAPAGSLRWIDVGCGNGAFTELIVQRCAPAGVEGVDPSQEQLAFARTRPASRIAKFTQGDAMALPFADKSFDVAVMALVIFFVPNPAKGIAEMVRAVRAGGSVAAYAWDMYGGGFPWDSVQSELRALGQKSCTRRVLMRHVSTRCVSCGRTQAWLMSKHGRSPCNGRFRILMNLHQSA